MVKIGAGSRVSITMFWRNPHRLLHQNSSNWPKLPTKTSCIVRTSPINNLLINHLLIDWNAQHMNLKIESYALKNCCIIRICAKIIISLNKHTQMIGTHSLRRTISNQFGINYQKQLSDWPFHCASPLTYSCLYTSDIEQWNMTITNYIRMQRNTFENIYLSFAKNI